MHHSRDEVEYEEKIYFTKEENLSRCDPQRKSLLFLGPLDDDIYTQREKFWLYLW